MLWSVQTRATSARAKALDTNLPGFRVCRVTTTRGAIHWTAVSNKRFNAFLPVATEFSRMSDIGKKKTRLFHESVKDLHTSHWDLDLVSREELEAIMTGALISPRSVASIEHKDDDAAS